MTAEVAIITPTLWRPELEQAIASVAQQTYPCTHIVVCDGATSFAEYCLLRNRFPRVRFAYWPLKVGGGTWYGNRIIAAAPFLTTAPFIGFLNDDDWFRSDHVANLVTLIEKDGLDWAYSHRSIHQPDGTYVFEDRCEALGEEHEVWNMPGHRFVDTCAIIAKTHVFRTVAPIYCSDAFGRDRDAYQLLSKLFPKFKGVTKPTVCFRVGSSPNSATLSYFAAGNDLMHRKYGDTMPWESDEQELLQSEADPAG
jgi:glycosyltransferase involved in cell wall biosynthesis